MTDMLANSPVIPVVAIDEPDHAVPLCHALLQGGIEAIEVTLRTEKALEAIEAIKKECPDMILGVGTVLKPVDVLSSEVAGADFLVSPGLTPDLIDAFKRSKLLALPGTATPSEAMTAYEYGFEKVKLFPAEAVGGAALIKSVYAPLPNIQFMPTGGVRPENMTTYLSLPNVYSVGGTWIAKREDIQNENWVKIRENAKAAMEIARALKS